MLESYYKKASKIQQLRSGIFGAYMDGFADELHFKGYSWQVVQKHLRSVFRLDLWLQVNEYSIETLCFRIIKEFQKSLVTGSCPIPKGSRHKDFVGARYFINYLQKIGIVSFEVDPVQPENPPLFTGFHRWMKMHRGVTDKTLKNYKPFVLDVIKTLGVNPDQYQARNIREYIINQMKNTERVKTISNSLRMFLRYLVAEGLCQPELVDAVPRIACWRFSTIPRYIKDADVQRIIDTCNFDTPQDYRNRAIILLLARLGLRADDVAKMRLGDINWNEGSILFSGKGRREALLPLPQEVGDAILVYLEYGRPKVLDDHVFLTAFAPIQPFKSGSAVSKIVKRAIRRAGVIAPSNGALILRHSAATTMLNQGASLNEIASILRHRSIDTTEIYAKVHRSLLQEIIQPWPEVQPC